MDSLKERDIIEKVLKEYADFLGSDEEVQMELVFDRDRDRYLLVETGWQNGYRIYGTLLHIDIIDNQLWIQHDGTEDGIAVDLIAAGIPRDRIVLGFRNIEERKHTDLAVSR
ncbi:MAG TPA: XisI protein [Leptolyngbyaceae cyanobacterium]